MFHVKQNGEEIPVGIVRTDRKSVTLEICQDGSLLVRAPLGYKEADAEKFVEKYRAWIEKHRPAILNRHDVYETISREDEETARKIAAETLYELVKFYAAKMQLCPTHITITGARKRFGSCSTKNAVSFSFRLMFYPPEAVQYVVVHELAHIRHHDHSAAFHRLIRQTIPQADDWEKLLKPECASRDNLEKNRTIPV